MNENRNSYDGREGHSSIHELEWEKLKSDRIKGGYREGISVGEEASLQEGFNEGYIKGFKIIQDEAKLRGIITAITDRLHQREPHVDEDGKQLTATSSSSEAVRTQLMDLANELSNLEPKLIEGAITASANDHKRDETKRSSSDEDTSERFTSDIDAKLVKIKSCCAEILEKYDKNMPKLFQ